MVRLGMVIDLKRCVGCDSCTISCKAEQATPPNVFYARVNKQIYGKYPDVKGFFLPVLCNHCQDPPCLKACPSHAIYKTENGIVLVDEEKCVGARACVSACPYRQMFFPLDGYGYFNSTLTQFEQLHNSKRKPNIAIKCNLCSHRLAKNMEPACVTVCPTQCRIFGDLDDPNSKISKYLSERTPKAEPIPLRPEADTKPKVMYLL